MRRTALFMSMVAALLIGVALPLTPASATGPSLACNIQPSNNDNFNVMCGTSIPTTSYTISYVVQGGSGTYTYSWTPPAGGTNTGGCTSTTFYCDVSVHHGDLDHSYVATVVLTQGGTKTTLKSTAFIAGVCGNMFC